MPGKGNHFPQYRATACRVALFAFIALGEAVAPLFGRNGQEQRMLRLKIMQDIPPMFVRSRALPSLVGQLL